MHPVKLLHSSEPAQTIVDWRGHKILMRGDRLEVPLGRISIEDEVRIHAEPPREIRARLGAKLLLRVPYEAKEASSDREIGRLYLETRIGRKGPPPVMREIEDRRGRYDARRGALEQIYELKQAGEFDLEFEIAAEYVRSDRSSGEIRKWDQRTSSGKIHLVVD